MSEDTNNGIAWECVRCHAQGYGAGQEFGKCPRCRRSQRFGEMTEEEAEAVIVRAIRRGLMELRPTNTPRARS